MNSLDDFLSSLVGGSTHAILNPKTLGDLQKKGVKFDRPREKSVDEALEELFSKRKALAASAIAKFPTPPNIAIPTIGFLYDEIRECIIFGLYGAAISLSAILVEFSLKHAIVRKLESGAFDKSVWERVENIELGAVITEAKSSGIITGEIEKKLINFKNTVRNPYLHYNIKKLIKNVEVKKVKRVDTVTRKVEELDLIAEDNPITWVFAKKFVDKERVFNSFKFADSVVKYLFEEAHSA
jgi:hypothetical protein